MSYHKKTQQDLSQIKDIETKIKTYKKTIESIKDNCPHLDQEAFVEMEDIHDFKVYKQCVVCRKTFRTATDEEKRKAIIDHYNDIEVSYTEEDIAEMIKKV